jgi:hypothetical protein
LAWWTKPEKTTFIGGPNLRKPPLLVDQTWDNHLYWWTNQLRWFSSVGSTNKGGFLRLISPIKVGFFGWDHQ